MKLHVIARGRIGRGPEADLVTRYARRISWPIVFSEIGDTSPLPEPAAGTRTVVLDERGVALSSRVLAERLAAWRDDGVREVRFLIGGADGHDDVTRDASDLLVSFGPATWPHLMVRAMLAEQLYRATSLLARHPYHRDG